MFLQKTGFNLRITMGESAEVEFAYLSKSTSFDGARKMLKLFFFKITEIIAKLLIKFYKDIFFFLYSFCGSEHLKFYQDVC